jgi:hypothetical protein
MAVESLKTRRITASSVGCFCLDAGLSSTWFPQFGNQVEGVWLSVELDDLVVGEFIPCSNEARISR